VLSVLDAEVVFEPEMDDDVPTVFLPLAVEHTYAVAASAIQ